jgi:hypothetical protein
MDCGQGKCVVTNLAGQVRNGQAQSPRAMGLHGPRCGCPPYRLPEDYHRTSHWRQGTPRSFLPKNFDIETWTTAGNILRPHPTASERTCGRAQPGDRENTLPARAQEATMTNATRIASIRGAIFRAMRLNDDAAYSWNVFLLLNWGGVDEVLRLHADQDALAARLTR